MVSLRQLRRLKSSFRPGERSELSSRSSAFMERNIQIDVIHCYSVFFGGVNTDRACPLDYMSPHSSAPCPNAFLVNWESGPTNEPILLPVASYSGECKFPAHFDRYRGIVEEALFDRLGRPRFLTRPRCRGHSVDRWASATTS